MKPYKFIFTTILLSSLLLPISFIHAQETEQTPIVNIQENEQKQEVQVEEETTTNTVFLQDSLEESPTYSFSTILLAILVPCLFLVLIYLIFKLVKF